MCIPDLDGRNAQPNEELKHYLLRSPVQVLHVDILTLTCLWVEGNPLHQEPPAQACYPWHIGCSLSVDTCLPTGRSSLRSQSVWSSRGHCLSLWACPPTSLTYLETWGCLGSGLGPT